MTQERFATTLPLRRNILTFKPWIVCVALSMSSCRSFIIKRKLKTLISKMKKKGGTVRGGFFLFCVRTNLIELYRSSSDAFQQRCFPTLECGCSKTVVFKKGVREDILEVREALPHYTSPEIKVVFFHVDTK